jgi:tRNA 2-thiocytidine biosynthesis protein TtcA
MAASLEQVVEQAPRASRAIMQLVAQAVRDFGLIEPGDRVAVALSGGKDSFLLAMALKELAARRDMSFELGFVHLDQRQPGFDRATFERGLAMLQIECQIIEQDTYSEVQRRLKPGQIPCSICGRMRRGILNAWCAQRGYHKLALGHHLDDAIETFLLNLFYGRRLEALKPLTPASEVEVSAIRPLILVEERKIAAWSVAHEIPVVACPVCDTVPESRRRDLKEIMARFQSINADLHGSVRAALYEHKTGASTDVSEQE